MVWSWYREQRIFTHGFVCNEPPVLAFRHQLTRGGFKSQCPVERLDIILPLRIRMQVVDDIAAANDQDSLVTKRP